MQIFNTKTMHQCKNKNRHFVDIIIYSECCFFAVKENGTDPIRFHRTIATLQNKNTEVKYKIWKIAIFYDNGCYLVKYVIC